MHEENLITKNQNENEGLDLFRAASISHTNDRLKSHTLYADGKRPELFLMPELF